MITAPIWKSNTVRAYWAKRGRMADQPKNTPPAFAPQSTVTAYMLASTVPSTGMLLGASLAAVELRSVLVAHMLAAFMQSPNRGQQTSPQHARPHGRGVRQGTNETCRTRYMLLAHVLRHTHSDLYAWQSSEVNPHDVQQHRRPH